MNPKSFPLRLLYSVLAAAILIVIVKSCGYDALRKDFSDRFKKDMATLQQESSPYEDINLLNPAMISAIYEDDEEFVLPKWGNRNKVDAMIQAIRESENDGLRPEDYHLAAIDSLTAKVFDQKEVELEDEIKLELLLTDAYLLLSTHLSQGKTDRETIDPTWKAAGREARPELAAFVDSTIVNDNVLESLKSLTPKHREYINLKRGLKKYRELARLGGWQKVNFTATKLEKGMRHPDVSLLKERLNIETESSDTEVNDLFDLKLEQKVKNFQELNGLTPDGVIGRGTMEALNISVEDRIANIEANLERWRWLSDDLGKRYVKVYLMVFLKFWEMVVIHLS